MEQSNSTLTTPLTEEEKIFLSDQKRSEHFRVFQKAVLYFYSTQCAMLINAKQEELPRIQGVLQGLTMAKNIMAQGMMVQPEQKNQK